MESIHFTDASDKDEDRLSEIEQRSRTIHHDTRSNLHLSLQQQLHTLRLETIKTYMKLLKDGEGPFAENKEHQLQLHAEIQGLGPMSSLTYHLIVIVDTIC